MQSFGLETAFATGGKFPPQFAFVGGNRVELAIVASEVNCAVVDGRSRSHGTARRKFPERFAGGSVERVKSSAIAADKQRASLQNRRGENPSSRGEGPFHAMKFCQTFFLSGAGMPGIATKHRLGGAERS